MDQFSNGSSASQASRPGHRDMMFCHECSDEWYRDEHGLTCPVCQSDFTEIIEENNDPRDSIMLGNDDGSVPDLETTSQGRRNPHTSDDPDDPDISNFQFTQTAPGRFNVQATITRSISPQGLPGGMGLTSIGGFMSILNGLAGADGRAQDQGQQQGEGQNRTTNQDPSPFGDRTGGATGMFPPYRSRFTYSAGARLLPRDPNNPQPRVEPVDDITNVMAGLMAALGAPPGSFQTHTNQQGGAHATFRSEQMHEDAQSAVHNPFFQILSSMSMLGSGGQMGDFVYSQEGLDGIITQLMEQTASSNAPGPASQTDVDALPRKEVTVEMLGPEGRAECSICMDEVNIGEEVTELPCKHWFHHPCVSAWLLEHDTCPHCRKGITKQQEGQSGSASTYDQSSSSSNPTSYMPGAFDSSSSTPTPQANATGADANQGGGLTDMLRRGLFGPQS